MDEPSTAKLIARSLALWALWSLPLDTHTESLGEPAESSSRKRVARSALTAWTAWSRISKAAARRSVVWLSRPAMAMARSACAEQ